jgi:hypothetical protein
MLENARPNEKAIVGKILKLSAGSPRNAGRRVAGQNVREVGRFHVEPAHDTRDARVLVREPSKKSVSATVAAA